MKSSQTGRKLQGKDILIEGGSYRDSLMMMDGEEEFKFFEWVITMIKIGGNLIFFGQILIIMEMSLKSLDFVLYDLSYGPVLIWLN